jgi:predicted transcriptional regulator
MKQTRIKDFSHAPMDDLRQERSDLYSVAHALGARAAAITAKADEIGDEIARREGDMFDVTDHAVLQYLKRVRGYDVESVRDELKQIMAAAVPTGALRGQAEAYTAEGLVFVVSRRRLVVTVYPQQQAEEIEPMITSTAFELP